MWTCTYPQTDVISLIPFIVYNKNGKSSLFPTNSPAFLNMQNIYTYLYTVLESKAKKGHVALKLYTLDYKRISRLCRLVYIINKLR